MRRPTAEAQGRAEALRVGGVHDELEAIGHDDHANYAASDAGREGNVAEVPDSADIAVRLGRRRRARDRPYEPVRGRAGVKIAVFEHGAMARSPLERGLGASPIGMRVGHHIAVVSPARRPNATVDREGVKQRQPTRRAMGCDESAGGRGSVVRGGDGVAHVFYYYDAIYLAQDREHEIAKIARTLTPDIGRCYRSTMTKAAKAPRKVRGIGHQGGVWTYEDAKKAGNKPVSLMLTTEEVAALDEARKGESRARYVGALILADAEAKGIALAHDRRTDSTQ